MTMPILGMTQSVDISLGQPATNGPRNMAYIRDITGGNMSVNFNELFLMKNKRPDIVRISLAPNFQGVAPGSKTIPSIGLAKEDKLILPDLPENKYTVKSNKLTSPDSPRTAIRSLYDFNNDGQSDLEVLLWSDNFESKPKKDLQLALGMEPLFALKRG